VDGDVGVPEAEGGKAVIDTPEGKWQVWRKSEIAGGNLVMHHSGYDDVRGDTLNSTLVAEFDTHQEGSAFMAKDVARFLRAFKLKDKRAIEDKVWTLKGYKVVQGFTYAFRRHSGLRDWEKTEHHDKPKQFVPKSVAYLSGSVRLLNIGRKWWLHYGKGHNTGGFKSRNEALKWHLQDGR